MSSLVVRAVLPAVLLLSPASISPGFSQQVTAQSPAVKQQIESHLRQAQEYLRANRPDGAIGEFESILKLDPNDIDARGNLGVLLYFKGDYGKAIPNLRTALKAQPSLSKIQALLGMSEK